VRIALTPARVAVASGGAYRDAAVEVPGWAGALEALAALLAGSRQRGRASVTLSHQFAPVHLLASPPVALKAAEMQGWVRDTLVRQFAEAGRDWRVAWQPEPPGEPFLASSLDAAQLAELEGVLRAASLKLASVQPWLVAAWNRRRRKLGRGRAWFALAEPGRLTLAGLAGGRARSLRSAALAGDAVAALADLLARETLLAGEAELAPLWVESALPDVNWQGAGGGRAVQPFAGGRDALAVMLEG
jgi:hypothetical protein